VARGYNLKFQVEIVSVCAVNNRFLVPDRDADEDTLTYLMKYDDI
jgi:hypothetical protein